MSMRRLADRVPDDGQECTIWTREIAFADATYRTATAENMGPVWDLGPHAPPVPVLSRDYWEPVYPVTEVCEWTREYDYWASGCDYAFDLVDGGTPAENDYTFCPGCGKEIHVKEAS